MAWLNPDRMPVRFSVATSVASGLIVATILKVASSGIADTAVFIWCAVAAVVAGFVAWFGVSVFAAQRQRSARAFFMTSAFDQKYYVAAFVQRMHGLLDRDNIDLVLKVPDRDYDASAQSHHLKRISIRRREYIGGIVFAAEVDRLRGDLIRFCRTSRLPVVFTDIEPFDRVEDYPKNSAYIGYDTARLGELAGEWLGRKLRDTVRPHVLIVASCEHNARQQQCEKALRAARPDVMITTDETCEFIRSRAYNAVRTHIRQLDSGQRLDAIFCTNDEMALGAVDALATASPVSRDTMVIGVDGTVEARELIDSGQSPLRATVVQDTHRLAGGIVDLLQKMRSGHAVNTRTILPAEVYEAT